MFPFSIESLEVHLILHILIRTSKDVDSKYTFAAAAAKSL